MASGSGWFGGGEAVVAHSLGHEVGQRRLEVAHTHFDGTPAAGPVGNEVAGNAAMEFKKQRLVQRAFAVKAAFDVGLNAHNALGQQRRELAVA